MALTVVLADSDEVVRERLERFLGRAVVIVGEARSGEEAVELAARSYPDVVVMDLRIHGLNSLSAVQRIRELCPETKVLLLTTQGEEAYLNATGKSGADAILPKQRFRRDLLRTIRGLAERRRRAARPRDVAGWDGGERRRRSWSSWGTPDDTPIDKR
jgi:DNA-binding NarL/FixJ family response regulator